MEHQSQRAGYIEDAMDIRPAAKMLVRWSPLIALATVISVLLAFWLVTSGEPTYSATVTVYSDTVTVDDPSARGADGMGLPVYVYAELAKSDVTRAFVHAQVGGRPGDYEVTVKEGSVLFVVASSHHAATAKDIIAAWMISFPLQVESVLRDQIQARRAVLQQLNAVYAELPQSPVQDAILAEVAGLALDGLLLAEMDKLTVLDGPTEPVQESRRSLAYMILAGLLGCWMAGVLVLTLAWYRGSFQESTPSPETACKEVGP